MCHRCQGKGHYSNVCTAPAPVLPSNAKKNLKFPSSDADNMSGAIKDNGVSNSDTYTLGSGSIINLTKNKEHLSNFVSSTGSITDIAAGSLKIHGYGSVEFEGPGCSIITIHNVAYVPEATRNLISVQSITKVTGLDAIFDEYHCELSNGLKIGTSMDDLLCCFDFLPKSVYGVSI